MPGPMLGYNFAQLPADDAAERQRQAEIEEATRRMNLRQSLPRQAERLIELTQEESSDDADDTPSTFRHTGHGGRF